jgi:ankyrin repeat protein
LNAKEIALRLVEAGADVTWKTGPSPAPEGFPELEQLGGGTFLMHAAGWGAMDVAKALLDRGMDINEKDAHGRTAVMMAAYAGQGDMVDFLASRGASLEGCDIEGNDIRALAKNSPLQSSLPSVTEVFRRIADNAESAAHNGLDQPISVARKPLRFKNRAQFFYI